MATKTLAAVIAAGLILGLGYAEFRRLGRERAARLESVPVSDAPVYGCSEDRPLKPPHAGKPGLVDVTDDVNLDFQHIVGPLGTYFMPESIGAGGALFDFNGDGRLDLYLVNCGPSPGVDQPLDPTINYSNRLFEQTEDGTFRDATESSGLGDTGYGAGCAVGDIDNDGHPDVYITNFGRDRLYRNRGDGTFEDVTEAVGLGNDEWGTCAAMVDYDRDGWLDLIVVNYTSDPVYNHSIACGFRHNNVSYCGPHKFEMTVDRLYHNEGRSGVEGEGVRFREVTNEAGLDQATTYGFGVIAADLTDDGWPDFFVANDGEPNRLWVNQQNGTFLEEAVPRGVAVNGRGVAEAGMGVSFGDVNGDSHLDLAVSHLSAETTTMYVSDGQGTFEDQTDARGLEVPTRSHTGWGAGLIDLDLDGLLDLPLVDGLVIPCRSGFPFHGEDTFQERHDVITNQQGYWREYADDNVLLMGQAGGQFRDDPELGGDFCNIVASGRSLIDGDLDNDGDLDLIVTNCGMRARVYRNDLPRRGHWLKIRALTGDAGRDALGATVTVQAGEQVFTSSLTPQTSYLASHEPVVHFGLGNIERIDEIRIHWPDGPVEDCVESFPGTAVDQTITLRRGSGTAVNSETPDTRETTE